MYIVKTTQSERICISSAMDTIMLDVENSLDMLQVINDDYFQEIPNPEIDEFARDRIGLMIRVAGNVLFEALNQYHLIVCEDFRGIKPTIESFNCASLARDVNNTADRVHQLLRKMPNIRAEQARKELSNIMILPDEQALPALNDLARRCGGSEADSESDKGFTYGRA